MPVLEDGGNRYVREALRRDVADWQRQKGKKNAKASNIDRAIASLVRGGWLMDHGEEVELARSLIVTKDWLGLGCVA